MQAPNLLGGRYELRGVLGRGGMAEVRDGWDTRLDRAVAVKLLYPVFSAQPENRRRFETEARAAAALNHPHIVAVHDSGEDPDGTPFIVMERLPGRTLAHAIAAGPLPPQQVRSILHAVLSALAAAHAAGTLHRDIKPGNILFTDFGDIKVADFGIAKSADTTHTATGQLVGTLAYLSADRIAGRPASVVDDLYAAGVVGYEMLTGRRPFPQQNLGQLARAVAEGAPPPLTALRPDTDPVLAAVIERAMARDPRQRFGSADTMRAALDAPVAGPPVAGPPVGGPVRSPTLVLDAPLPEPATVLVAPATRRSRARRIVVAVVAVIAIAVAAIAFIVDAASRTETPQPASTSTSVPVSTSSSVVVVPAPAPTVPQSQPNPGQRKGNRGDNGRKPKGEKGD